MKLPSCDICHRAVTVREGGCWVSMGDVEEYEKERLTWGEKDPGELGFKMTEFPDFLKFVPWRWGHLSCSDSKDEDYSIPAGRMCSRTSRRAIAAARAACTGMLAARC